MVLNVCVFLVSRILQGRRGTGLSPLLTTVEPWASSSCMTSPTRSPSTLCRTGKGSAPQEKEVVSNGRLSYCPQIKGPDRCRPFVFLPVMSCQSSGGESEEMKKGVYLESSEMQPFCAPDGYVWGNIYSCSMLHMNCCGFSSCTDLTDYDCYISNWSPRRDRSCCLHCLYM